MCTKAIRSHEFHPVGAQKPTLCDLPSEILTLVYGLHNNIYDAVRLSSTCQRLRSIWIKNSHHLYWSILRQQILCYDDALRLVEAQERATSKGTLHGFEKVLVPAAPSSTWRVRQVLQNATIAKILCDVVVRIHAGRLNKGIGQTSLEIECCPVHPLHGLPHERERATHCIYYLQCFVLVQRDHELRQQHELEITKMGKDKLQYWFCVSDSSIDLRRS